MKVLFASSLRGWGGGERWLLEAATGLASLGHDVRVAPRRGTALATAARRRGLAVHPTSYGGLLDPRAPLALERLLADHDVEIVIANLEKELWHAALATLPHPGVALVNRRGSPIPIRSDARRRWLYGRVPRILVNAESVARALYARGAGYPREQVEILENGWSRPPGAFEPSPHDWPAGEGLRLIAVGGLTPEKNPLGLLRALQRVRAPWRLLWVGRGPLGPAFDRLAGELGLAARVRRLGWVEEAWRWSAAADLFVHFSNVEGQSWAVLEALASGTPAVVSGTSGWNDLLAAIAGRRVEPGDEAGLATVLEELLADAGERRRLGAAAAEHARATQTPGAQVEALERSLERVRWEQRGRRPVIFLDRDGTLTPEGGALGDPERLRLLPGVGEGLRALAGARYECIVVTNQAAIGRGLVTAEAVQRVQARLRCLVRREGVELAAVYQCPHRPEDRCSCRKPKTGLWDRARDEIGVPRTGAWTIGDSLRDVLGGRAAGTRTILLSSGWGGFDPATRGLRGEPDGRARDLREAANRIVRR